MLTFFCTLCFCLVETYTQISAEFTWITTIPLIPKFMSQLDHYSDKLARVLRKKGGAAGRKIKTIMAVVDQVCVITCIIIDTSVAVDTLHNTSPPTPSYTNTIHITLVAHCCLSLLCALPSLLIGKSTFS